MESGSAWPERPKRGRRGAALIEAAFVLPLFLIFLFGIIDWGIAFFIHESIVHHANAAVRWAVVNDYDPGKIRNVFLYGRSDASGDGSAWFSLHPPTVAVNQAGSDATHDLRVTMTVSDYQWMHFTPFLSGRYFGRPFTVSLPAEDLKTGE